MGKGRTKVSVPSNTVLGQLQQSLSLHIKQCRKAGQPVRLSASQFEADVALVLGSFEQDQGSHTARLDAASEAFQVLTQLLPLAPDSAQDVSRDARRLIVQRCWSLWEATGAMTHCARAALKALISLEKQEETQPGVAASNLLDLLKAHSLANKRSLGCLHVLLPVIPQSYFQLHFPDLLPQLLHIITLSELAPHAGKVAVELVQLLLAPSKHDDTEAIVYSDIATSLTRRLLHSDFQSRTFLGLYLLLPIITLDSRWYNALHDNLNSSGSEPTGSESALAASFCLIETGLKAGAVTRQSISKEMLDLGLSSCESSLRMSALSIICRPPPTRQVFLAKDDFDLLEKHFLHHISQTSDSEERNAVSGHWKVLLDRTKASTHAAARSLQSHDKNSDASYFQTHLDEAKTFLLAACNIFVDRLQPTSPYRAQSSALRFLSNMLLIGLFSCWKSSTPIPPSLQRTQVEWPFSLESHLDMTRLLRLVSRCLVSTYEDIQNTAAWVLHGFPTVMLPACLRDDTQLRLRIQTLTTSGRECRAESAALLLKFAQRQNHTKSAFKLALAAAETEIDQVKHNLALAAASFPMHGAIQCLITSLNDYSLAQTDKERLLALVDSVYEVTSPVMTNNAPEGSEVVDHEEARALDLKDLDDTDEIGHNDGGGSATHKAVMSACWRAMKQAGALLEQMIVSTIETGHNFWTRQEVELVGSRFHEYLLSIRHRGCFMAIASNYQTFISSIVSAAGRTDLTSLPEEWLKARLDESRSTSLSYTRRSAGLPYLILAIVNSTTYTDPALLDLATASLFEIADEHKTPMNKDAVVNTAVHAINTLRMMFLETQIGIQMLMHAEKGFSLAINSFRSPYWPIRNAALLLYSALIQRVFSSRNRKSEAGITHKWSGRLSRTDFFQAYPSLEPLLLQELRHSVESGSLHATNTADQSSLFAVLLLLSKLATPVRLPEESFADDELLLSVRQCFGSRVWKVREAAGDASSGLVAPTEVSQYMQSLVIDGGEVGENELHGRWLSVLRVVQCHSLDSNTMKTCLIMVERAALRMAKRSFATRHPFCQALLCLAENGVRYDLPNFRESLQTISGYALAVSQHGQFTFSPAGASVMLMIEPQKDHVLSSLLQPEAPSSLKVIALQFCSKRPDTLTSPLQQKIWEVAVSQTSSLDTRLAALQLIQNQSIVATEGVFQTSLQTCLSAPRGPLREALMPLIASQVDRANFAQRINFANLVLDSSHEEQSELSRMSAVASLFPPQGQDEIDGPILLAILRLLQDDDAQIRKEAETAAQLYIQTPIKSHQGIAAQKIAARLFGMKSASSLIEESLLQPIDTRRLEPCNEALFVDERPNLFIDDMFNVENAVSSINSSDTASPPVTAKQSTLVLCRAFSDALIHHKKVNNSNSTECEDEDDLLDLPSKPEWYGAARRLQLACQAVNIETPREVLRMLY